MWNPVKMMTSAIFKVQTIDFEKCKKQILNLLSFIRTIKVNILFVRAFYLDKCHKKRTKQSVDQIFNSQTCQEDQISNML